MRALPPRRGASRRMAVLGAAALLLPGLAVAASAAGGPAAASPAGAAPMTAAAASVPAQLPTSWPAVPVEQRLQPWLADVLAAGGSDPLRVMVSGETTAAASAAVTAAGLTTLQTWDKVGIVVAAGTPDQVSAVVGLPGVTYVEGDQPLGYTLDTAHAATRSDQALATYRAPDGSRIDGSGVTIAVIDSGIDGTHPMFVDADDRSKVVQNRKNICGATFEPSLNEACFEQSPSNDTDTPSAGGHGTHVAGIAGGYEVTTTAPEGTSLRGSAPGAKLVGLSVGAAIGLLDANSAMTWVVDHQRNPCKPASAQDEPLDPECPPIRATNHSYGPIATEGEDQEFDPNSATVRIQRTLVEQGVTVVWAAGNDGGDGSFAATNPAGMDPTPGVLMVASYNDGGSGNRDNALSGFSSRGKEDSLGTYPDVSAPGDLITSACRPTLAVCQGAPSYDAGDYQTISGTSMAAPYVAGVAAQVAQANPAVTPAEVEDLVEDTAYKFTAGAPYEADPRNPDDVTSFDKGHGLVDVAALLAAQQGLPSPDAPAPLCDESSPQVVDPEGDATQIVLVDGPGPSQSDLDVQRAWLSWDGNAKELTFSIQVTDLAGETGDEYFRFYVTRESDPEVYAVANRDAAGESFSVKQFDAGTSTTVTGAFDEETNVVTVVLPVAQYDEVIPGAKIAVGDTIATGQVLGQRDTGVVTATADTGAGSCPFVVGQSLVPSPSPSPSPSGSPEPSGSPSPSPSPSGSPDPSGSPSPSPSPSDGSTTPQARTIDNACPEGEVPDSGRRDADGNTHERAIDCVVWWEIARGTSATDFDVEVPVSRGQMASFVAQLIEESGGTLDDDAPNAFRDDDGNLHEDNIDKLAAADIVGGMTDGRYHPELSVTRGQMATFLVKAYEHVSDQALAASEDYFSDDNGTTHEDSINRAAEAGFAAGRVNGDYDPFDAVLRDQMASFLARVLDLQVDEGTTTAKA